MNKQEVFRTVTTYLIKDFEVPENKIQPEANLFFDLGLDSIDALDWFAKMESAIGLPIIEDELKKLQTVQDVVNYVMRNLKANAEELR